MTSPKLLCSKTLVLLEEARVLLRDPYLRPTMHVSDEEVALQLAAAVEVDRAARAIAKLLEETL